MKKNRLFIIAVVICIILATLTTAYLLIHPMDKALFRLSRRNFNVNATVELPILGETSVGVDIDKDLIHIHKSVFLNETYIEITEEDIFVYTKNQDGVWKKEKIDIDESDLEKLEIESGNLKEIFNHKNYDKVEGSKVYKQKDDVEFKYFDKMKFTVNDDNLIISGTLKIKDYTIGFSFDISEFGDIDIEKPINE